MASGMSLVVLAAIICLLIAGGTWVAVALGVTGLVGFHAFLPAGMAKTIGWISFNMMNSFIMVAVPLFILMGELILRGGFGERLYTGVSTLIHGLPGGLLHGNIVSCSIFAAISGSSTATAATIGIIAIPALEKRGYDRKLTVGSLAAGGTLGILIPPSLQFILYGVLTETSVGQLFIAGVIPGIILSSLFMVYIMVRVLLRPTLQPAALEKASWKVRLSGLVQILPMGSLILLVLIGIYTGIVTPTESAAIGASGALVLCLVYRSLSWQALQEALGNTVRVTTMILFIMVSANLFTSVLVNLRVPHLILELIVSLKVSPLTVLAFIIMTYLVLGCFFDPVSMTLITIPVFFPLIVALGYNPIWFGVIQVLMCETGSITPPVGLNLFVIQGLRPQYPSSEVIVGSAPFVIIIIVMVAILIACPELALWLPAKMH